ncbi:alanine acetyltransferase [Paenibacillus sp. PK3_47]|uniref:GNAT family N-acetyltransferase n=1 Tax=Paenibacillus sp. PK3_47 TaxID=2072642 RepID=UPI00201E2FC7|nr:GNAT family protein [Paenibacillus sp. PK3_47]UQZ34880.1 alanine acetyltransferase [Paenibacillus sp. PK3_47]
MNTEALFGQFPVLRSEKLILAKIEDKHLDDVYAIYSNKKVFQYCGILPKTNIAAVKSMIGHFERDYLKRSRVKWGIISTAEPDKLLGIIEVMDCNQKVNMLTVGYFLAEAYWGQGIAAEALRVLLEYLFSEVQVNRVQAEVMPPNEASKQVLLKNGFIKEGALRQAALWTGQGIVDLELYSVLKEDYGA